MVKYKIKTRIIIVYTIFNGKNNYEDYVYSHTVSYIDPYI